MQLDTDLSTGPVIGVVGGSGGVGASTFAGVVAAAAGNAMLLDVDVDGGGIDVVLGIEAVSGARWSGLRLAGGALEPDALVDGLPAWAGCPVLAADVATLDPDAVRQVVRTAASAGTVVVDLPRRDCAERAAALGSCDVVLLLARGDIPGLVAAHAVASGLVSAPVLGLLVRRGDVGEREAATLVGVELVGTLPRMRGGGRHLHPARPPRAVARVVSGLLTGVSAPGAVSSPRRPGCRRDDVGVLA